MIDRDERLDLCVVESQELGKLTFLVNGPPKGKACIINKCILKICKAHYLPVVAQESHTGRSYVITGDFFSFIKLNRKEKR